MLSTSVIKNVSDASHYYSATDNYYTSEQGIEQSEWFGRGAQKLNLNHKMDAQQFSALLKGELPTGEIVGKNINGKMIHRAGWDLTFSAPKSVSIMALLGEDTRLLTAHRNAVQVALSEIERGCSETRIKMKDTVSYQHTQNLVAALFHHDLSRAEDPQLHTHSVVMNLTQRTDDKWRSMASKLGRYDHEAKGEVHGFIERVRHHKRFFGKLYETELAYQVQQLGYEIVTNEKTGVFEIKDVPREVIEFFSKRRKDIETHLQQSGFSGQKAAEIATQETRKNKTNVNRTELLKTWQMESDRLGFNSKDLIQKTEANLLNRVSSPEKPVDQSLLSILNKSINELSQFKTTFTLEDLVIEASSHAIHEKIDSKTIFQGIDKLVNQGDLLHRETEQGRSFYIARSTLDDEKRIQDIIHLHQKTHSYRHAVNRYQHLQSDLSRHERNALREIFSDEKNILIDGHEAKALSRAIVDIARDSKLSLAIVSPNQITSKTFSLDLNKNPENMWEKVKSFFVDTAIPHSSTLQFLKQNNKLSPDILVIDQAHLLSSKEQAYLLDWGSKHATKMLFFSEKSLLLSQRAGVGTDYLIKSGIKTITIKNDGNSIQQSISQKNVDALVTKIIPSIIDVSEQDDRLSAMAKHFSRLKDIKNTYLIGQTKETTKTLNFLAHHELKASGQIKPGLSLNVLTPVFVSENRQTQLTSYPVGHRVRFVEKNSAFKYMRNEYLHIIGHDAKNQEVLLKRPLGKIVRWRPTERAEVFKEEKREWSVGERLQAQRSMKFLNVVKGEHFTIQSINGTAIKLNRERGKSIRIDVSKYSHTHFDYGYATTLHQATHQKANHFIADLPAQAFTTDQRRFFQLVAQPESVSIYTDHSNKLIEQLNKKTGNRLTAHDTVQSSHDMKKNLTAFYSILQEAIQRPGEKEVTLSQKAVEAVDYAIHHLAERNAAYNHKDLLEVAMRKALGSVNREQLLQAVQAMEKANVIVRGKDNNGTLWTTQEAIKLEKSIQELTQRDQGKLPPIAPNDLIHKYIDTKDLNSEKISAIKQIIQSKDRVLAIQGRAGTGKTTMMASLDTVLSAQKLLSDEGFMLKGIAPTHKAVRELQARNIKAETIDRFLLNMRSLAESKEQYDFSNTVLIVDEASMVSNRKMRDILSIVHSFNFRQVIPTGDILQLPAIEAGKPDDLIQRMLKEKVIRLEDIQRQKTPILKEAVKAIYEGDVARTFNVLADSIIEIRNSAEIHGGKATQEETAHAKQQAYQTRVKALASDYVQLIAKNENVQIIAPAHDDKKTVNQEVRHQLSQQGYLTGDEYTFPILVAKDMTGVERSDVRNYKANEIVRFSISCGKNIKAGDYFRIQEIDKIHNVLVLSKPDSQETTLWQIPSKRINNLVEVFKQENRQLKMGDRITWVRTNQREGLLSTDSGTVTQLNKNSITLKRADQSTFQFDSGERRYQHWDHAYAITAHGAQGGTYSTILALFESYRKNLMNLKTFLVTLTRPENDLRIYTDNKDELQNQIACNKGDKLSSLEVIGQYPTGTTQNKQSTVEKKTALSKKSFVSIKEQYDILRIKEGLNQQAEQLAISILGEPKLRGGNYLKFGSKQGSLSVTIKGEKAGWWNDFSDAQAKGRSMLSFIEKQCNLDKKDAIIYAARWLGMAPNIQEIRSLEPTKSINKSFISPMPNETEHQRKMLARAKKIAQESINIQGTLAEKYLKEHRGIDTNKLDVSNEIRFHPEVYSAINKQKLPALVSLVRNKNSEIISIETVFLDKETGGKAKNIAVGKQTFGAKKGGAVLIQKGKEDAPIILAEGVVTGLSVANALPNATVKSVLGIQLFNQIDPAALPKKVIFCLDRDGKNLAEDKTIRAAADRLQAHGKEVSFMVPSGFDEKKYDYNDVLKVRGIKSIQNDFKKAISYSEFYKIELPQQLIKEGVKSLSHKMAIDKVQLKANSKAISPDEITRFSKTMMTEIDQNNKQFQNTYESISKPKSSELNQSINSKNIQVERDI